MMINIKSFVKLGLSSLFSLITVTSALATPVLEEIENTGLIKIALREDAVPFSYRNSNNEISGFCLDFINLLKEEIKNELNQEILSIRLYKSSLFNRFSLVEDGIVHLECGPNTIRTFKRERNIQFSSPFFVTGTQLLVRTENANNINLNGSLENVTIGVLRSSTNRRLMMRRYPQANLQEFLGVTGRLRGIQALQEGRIDAFASDGVLLIGEAVLQGLALGRDYLLIPDQPLECDYYGLILPSDDPNWKSLVDRTIQKAAKEGIFREWLGVILPEIQESVRYCNSQQESEEEQEE